MKQLDGEMVVETQVPRDVGADIRQKFQRVVDIVVPLTSRAAVASLASTALLGSFGAQRRRAGSAGREEVHFSVDS